MSHMRTYLYGRGQAEGQGQLDPATLRSLFEAGVLVRACAAASPSGVASPVPVIAVSGL